MKTKFEFALYLLLIIMLPSCHHDSTTNANNDTQILSCSAITADKTLSESTYNIDCIVEVKNGATLTIPAGAVMKFTGNGGFVTSGGGAIKALGTSAKPIRFTGKEAIKGYWFSVDINTNSLNNQFSYCVFEYGGEGTRSMVRLGSGNGDPAKAVFTNCTFSNGLKNGLYASPFSTIAGSANNIFIGNTEYPVSMSFENVDELDAGSAYTGNGKDMVYTNSDATYHSLIVSDAITFKKLGVPFFISNPLPYYFKGAVTVNAGVTLIMESNLAFEIQETGSFYCVGTPSQRITIKGLEATKGYWKYIWFDESSSSNNRIEYTDISDGGSNTGTPRGMVGNNPSEQIPSTTRIQIQNSSFNNSSAYGLTFFKCSFGFTFNGVTTKTNIDNEIPNASNAISFSNCQLGSFLNSTN